MTIYPSEKSIENKVKANVTSAFISNFKISEAKTADFKKSLEFLKDNKQFSKVLAEVAKDEHPDLMYGSAILVSTVKNQNDDLFLPAETWAAKDTPVNTPYNDNHVEENIIGHIIASRPLDDNGNPIDTEDCPDYFDVEVDFVIYKSIFPQIAAEIADKGPKGEKFVSMEARFDDFDYAIYENDKDVHIVERNKETAFLTQYLRAYGGDGQYNGKVIARALKNFRFTGMGNVDNPANKKSKYTKYSKMPKEKSKSDLTLTVNLDYEEALANLTEKLSKITKGNIMKIETLEQAETLIAELTNKVEALEKEKANDELNKTIESLKIEKTTLNDQLTAADAKIELSVKESTALKTEIESVKAELEAVKKKLADAEAKIGEVETKAKNEVRLAKATEIKLDISTDEKKSKVLSMSDEAFASVVEFAPSIKSEEKAEDQLENVENKTESSEEETKGGEQSNPDIKETAQKLFASIRNYNHKQSKSSKK